MHQCIWSSLIQVLKLISFYHKSVLCVDTSVNGLFCTKLVVTMSYRFFSVRFYVEWIDGLVQNRRDSSALAMELRLSCTNPSKSCLRYEFNYPSNYLNLLRNCIWKWFLSYIGDCVKTALYWTYASRRKVYNYFIKPTKRSIHPLHCTAAGIFLQHIEFSVRKMEWSKIDAQYRHLFATKPMHCYMYVHIDGKLIRNSFSNPLKSIYNRTIVPWLVVHVVECVS